MRMEGRGDVIVLSSNNYLGLAAHPEVCGPGSRGWSPFGAGPRPCASSAARSGPAQAARAGAQSRTFLQPRTRSSTTPASNANGELCHPDDPRTRRRDHQRRPEPCQHHRRRSAWPRRSAEGLPASRHGRPQRLACSDARRTEARSSPTAPSACTATSGSPRSALPADEFDAIVVVDDSHAIGFLGENGRGTVSTSGLIGPGRCDHRHPRQGARRRRWRPIASSEEVVDLLGSARGRTSSLTPCRRRWRVVRCVRSRVMLEQPELLARLGQARAAFREMLTGAGYRPSGARRRSSSSSGRRPMRSPSERLLDEGVFVTGFGSQWSPRAPRGSRACTDIPRRSGPGTSCGGRSRTFRRVRPSYGRWRSSAPASGACMIYLLTRVSSGSSRLSSSMSSSGGHSSGSS